MTFAVAAGREHVIDITMAELTSRLDARRFVRIHRSTIVNVAFVQELSPGIDGLIVRLQDGAATELIVARDRVRDWSGAVLVVQKDAIWLDLDCGGPWRNQ